MDKATLYKELEKQKEHMTSSERMAAYLRGEEVDYQPFGLLAPEDALLDIWGYTKGEEARSFDVRCELIRRREKERGLVGVGTSLGLRGMGEAMGSKIFQPEMSSDYVKEYVLKDYSMLESLMDFSVEKSPCLQAKLEEAKKLMELFPHMPVSTGVAGPLSTAITIRPIERVLRDMRRNPEELHQLLQLSVRASLEWVEVYCRETGCTSVSISDPVTTTDVVSKKQFLEFSKPYFKQLMDGIVAVTGQKPFVHICGHTKGIWTDLMDVGVDNFSLDNCESLEEAKQIMGEKVFLSGNISPVDALYKGTIDQVIEAVRNCLAQGADSPMGYMLMSGCQVPIGTPEENIDAFIYAARRYGRGARKGCLPLGLMEE